MDEAKRKSRESGNSVIDLSVGASDLPAPPEALQTLMQAVSDPSTHSCQCIGKHASEECMHTTAWSSRVHDART